MSDILNQIVAVKHEEVAAAQKRLPLAAMRADAESRVLTRDFEGALRAKIAKGQAAVIAEKVREDDLRALDWQVVRVTSDLLDTPAKLMARLRGALLRAGTPWPSDGHRLTSAGPAPH